MAPRTEPSLFGGEDEDADEGSLGTQVLALGLVIAVSLSCFSFAASCCAHCCCCLPCCTCCKRCKRRLLNQPVDGGAAGQVVKVGEASVQSALLKQKKELLTGYMLMLGAGLTGAHHIYLDRLAHGVCCMFSMNFLFFGFLLDTFLMPFYVSSANRGSSPAAHHDGTSFRICFRLPCLCVLLFVVPFTTLLYIPSGLHAFKVVNLHTAGAGTEKDPYEILGVRPGASDKLKSVAFKQKMLILKMKSPCDGACEAQKKELQKAYDYLHGVGFRKYKEKQEQEELMKNGASGQDKTRKQREKALKDLKEKERREQGSRTEVWGDWATYKQYEWDILTDVLSNVTNEWFKEKDASEAEHADEDQPRYHTSDEL